MRLGKRCSSPLVIWGGMGTANSDWAARTRLLKEERARARGLVAGLNGWPNCWEAADAGAAGEAAGSAAEAMGAVTVRTAAAVSPAAAAVVTLVRKVRREWFLGCLGCVGCRFEWDEDTGFSGEQEIVWVHYAKVRRR